MISLKEGLIAIIAGLLGGTVTYVSFPKAKPHYPLHSPENLARLARGRQIRHQQQRAMSANKRAEKREKLLEKLKRLA
jgi:hypothetical protein